MQNSDYFHCEHIWQDLFTQYYVWKICFNLLWWELQNLQLYLHKLFIQHIQDIEHPALFTEWNKYLRSIIQERVGYRKWKTFRKNKLIFVLVKFIGLQVFIMRLCGFTYRIFWVRYKTQLKTTSTNIYKVICWRCFLW